MKKQIFKIDKDGFLQFGQEIQINIEDEIPSGYIDTPLPTDERGYQLPFWSPRWTGSEWIEGATQEEIDELTKAEPISPTAEERINALEEALLLMMMEG